MRGSDPRGPSRIQNGAPERTAASRRVAACPPSCSFSAVSPPHRPSSIPHRHLLLCPSCSSPFSQRTSTMAEQLLEAVLALPADVNVFDFVLSEIGSQVYPRMSDGFWTQAHIATGAMGLGILMSVATLLIRARKGRLSWFIHDGPAIVRPSPKTWVPLFWSITAACERLGYSVSTPLCDAPVS